MTQRGYTHDMGYALGKSSTAKLAMVHGDLVRVVVRAIAVCTVDFTVVCGVRTEAEQRAVVARGASHTMHSLHLPQADGLAHAVDLAPVESGVVLWKDLAGFRAISHAMLAAADDCEVLIQWGGDWNCDGVEGDVRADGSRMLVDMPHYQLARPWSKERALAARNRRMLSPWSAL